MHKSLSRSLTALARAFSRMASPRHAFRIFDRSGSHLRQLRHRAQPNRIRGPPAARPQPNRRQKRRRAGGSTHRPGESTYLRYSPSQRSRERTRARDPSHYLAVHPHGNAVRALQTVSKPQELPVITGVIVLIAMLLGAVTGCILTMTLATAAISVWCESMMRRVRYWKAEAIRYREALEDAQQESSCETPGGRG